MSDNRLPSPGSGAQPSADDRLFERLADSKAPRAGASSRLKARIFSKLVMLQAAEGPLMSLGEYGHRRKDLCFFENLVAIAPLGEALKTRNPCRVCHARILGERVERAPVYWPGCPYVTFQQP